LKRLAPAILLALGLSAAHAQETPQNVAPVPETPPAVVAQPLESQTPTNNTAAAPVIEAPPPPTAPKPKPVAVAPPKPEIPPGPPPPTRSPTAILRVLDKVTAETLRFAAPVGRRVRYKTLIFVVKACETRGEKDALPRPSAYLVIDSEPLALPGRAAPAPKEIYRGWMFAAAPGLHPFEHPVYDAWLEACTDAPIQF
jgi:hypothetical protein